MPTKTQTPKIKFVPITPVARGTGFIDYWTALRDRIAKRAYQIFDARGRTHGHDIDDWLQAESQILKRIPLHTDEAEHLYTITADVSGFETEELNVRVEPFRVLITGAKIDSSGDGNSQEIFEAIYLDQEIETNTVIAELIGGVLIVSMRKAHLPPVAKVVNANLKSSKTRSVQLHKQADITKHYADAAKDHLRRAVAKEREARMRVIDYKEAGTVEPTPKDPPSVSWTEEAPHSPLG